MPAPWSKESEPSIEGVRLRLDELVARRLVGLTGAELQEYLELVELESTLLAARASTTSDQQGGRSP